MAVKWTTEQVERLIALYEAYPALYDIKDDKYYNRDEKSKVYAEIAADLQISGGCCLSVVVVLLVASYRLSNSN
jgi:hypothetical protein